jgi:hypothetical protein
MEPTCTHKQQNIKREKKERSLTFCQDLVMVPTYSHKQQNKKTKRGACLYQKLVMAPTKTKTKTKTKKKKKENRVFTFKLVLPNSLFLKL